MHGAREHKAVANVFAGRAVIAGIERVVWVANAIYIVEKFAEQAAPRLRFGERVMRGQAEATRDVALHAQHEGVVTGAVVGAENGRARIGVGTVAMVPLLMGIAR